MELYGYKINSTFSATNWLDIFSIFHKLIFLQVTKRGKILNRKIEKMTPQQKIKKLIDKIGMTDPKVVDITVKNLGK